MGDLSDMAGPAVELTVRGETYRFSPINLGDLAELESYLETIPLRLIRDQLKGFDSEERRLLLDRAYDDCAGGRISVLSESGAQFLDSARGLGRLLFLSLRKQHPDITIEQAQSLVALDNFEEMKEVLLKLSGLSGEEKEGDTENPTDAA